MRSLRARLIVLFIVASWLPLVAIGGWIVAHAGGDGGPADYSDLLALLALALLSAAVSIVLALFASRGIDAMLDELEGAARRIGRGDLESTVRTSDENEMGRTLSAFNAMTDELRRAQEKLRRAERIAAWRDIARRLAHEIKNPLSPIQVSIETMRKTYAKRHPDFDEIFEESTLTILEEVARLERIVSEFSRFARLPKPRPGLVDVYELADRVAALHSNEQVPVHALVGTRPGPIRADREQLTQALTNLVQNAQDAAKAAHGASGGRVRVTVSAARAGVRVEVADNGPGVPLDQRSRIFEPYFTTKPQGTGLGLAIAHRIIEDHQGSIEVGAGASRGAVFTLYLPEMGPPPEAEGTLTASLDVQTHRSHAQTHGR
ncbi:MAG: HAMP domain-containing protein [Myxococcales bacterium]|nr:HAMP domain-containing protein [Myxococcales bacterium]